MMNTYIAISAIMMFIVFGILLGNILHYGLVWTTRNSNVLYQSVKATKNLKAVNLMSEIINPFYPNFRFLSAAIFSFQMPENSGLNHP
mgnify:CR=1 FL=1